MHAKRLLLTDSTDEVPIADVAGPAAVLTEAHWDRFSPSLPEAQLKHVFFCTGGPAGPSIQGKDLPLLGMWSFADFACKRTFGTWSKFIM